MNYLSSIYTTTIKQIGRYQVAIVLVLQEQKSHLLAQKQDTTKKGYEICVRTKRSAELANIPIYFSNVYRNI